MKWSSAVVVSLCWAATAFGQPEPPEVQENVHSEVYPASVHKIFGWAGEPVHWKPSRPDDNDEVNDATKTYWQGQPFVPPLNVASQDDLTITCRDDEADIIIIQVMIDGKPDIVAQHVQGDGTVNWNGVAGENNQQHDHWPNGFGIVTIENFDNNQDRVIVTGHTVTNGRTWTTSDDEPVRQYGTLAPGVFTQRIYSQQGGGGGAHDEDTLGFIQFPDNEEARAPETVQTNVGVTETYAEFLGLVAYYAEVDAVEDVPDDTWDNFLLMLESMGLDPDDLTDDQLEFLFELLG